MEIPNEWVGKEVLNFDSVVMDDGKSPRVDEKDVPLWCP